MEHPAERDGDARHPQVARRLRGMGGMACGPGRAARAALLLLVLLLPVVMTGCTTVLARNAVPEERIDAARPYGIDVPLLRAWGDRLGENGVEEVVQSRIATLRALTPEPEPDGGRAEIASLALSGGGPDGAFGAGLLAGWTARGDRPEFRVVSGVSTGAIIALYAFLGPDYDEDLRAIYTDYRTSDLVTRTIFAGLTGGTALLDTRRYRALIERYVDDEVIAKIAEGYAEGRVLLIGTTNIDAARPVVWNIGAIAASGHPDAKRLIHDVIQASSAIPAAFPPVLIPVDAGGRRYDEMHVDGGATQQVMLFSPELQQRRIDEALGIDAHRTVYVVINNKLQKPYQPVRPRLASIAGRAASSLIGGSGTGDIFRIFAIAQRDGMDLRVMAIPTGFEYEPEEMFDPVYMQALWDLGYGIGLSGAGWLPHPPDFAPGD